MMPAAIAVGRGKKIRARALNLGRRTGVNLTYEWAGRLPQLRRGWMAGQTMNLGIGEGDLSVTPLSAPEGAAGIWPGASEAQPPESGPRQNPLRPSRSPDDGGSGARRLMRTIDVEDGRAGRREGARVREQHPQ